MLARAELAVLPLLIAFSSAAAAHHGPEDLVIELTSEIAARGGDPVLYVRRADELRILGQTEEARTDYERALALAPENRSALHGLAQAELDRGDARRAAVLARRAALAATPSQAAPFHALLAVASRELGDTAAELSAWESAIAAPRPEIDWLLAHAEALRRSGRADAACDALRAASLRNPSVVLRRAWLESLVEQKRVEEAAPLIEQELSRSRWKAYWLTLRGRLSVARGERHRRPSRRRGRDCRARDAPR